MPQGLQIWNASGVLTLDTSTKVGRVHGVISTVGSGSASSQNIPSLAIGTPFFLVEQIPFTGSYDRVTVSISGTTISWGAYSTGFNLYYGTY